MGKGKWRETSGRRRLQTATQSGVMPTPPPPEPMRVLVESERCGWGHTSWEVWHKVLVSGGGGGGMEN